MKNFLIVDDSAFMRNWIRRILVGHGYAVSGEAENGRRALEQYKELAPDYVTLDVTMDEMNGLDALKRIMEYDKEAMVIMVSAMGQEPVVRDSIVSGAKGFLVKPFDESTVLKTIESLN